MQKSRNDKFSVELLAFNMIVLAVVIGVLFAAFTSYYVLIRREDTRVALLTQASNIENRLSTYIDNMEVVSTQLKNSPYVRDIMKELYDSDFNNEFKHNIYIEQEIYAHLYTYVIKKNNINNVRVFNNRGDYISAGILESYDKQAYHMSTNYTDKLSELFNEDKIFTVYQSKPTYGSENEGVSAISIVSEIKDDVYKTTDTIGYVEVEMPVEHIFVNLEEIVSEHIQYIIYDSKTEELILTNFNEEQNGQPYNLTNIKSAYEKDMYIEQVDLSIADISVVVMQSRDETQKNIYIFLAGIGFAYLLLLVILIFIQKKMIKSLTKPLVDLCESVQNVKIGLDEEMPQIEVKGEFDVLSFAFNNMLQGLHKSAEYNVAAKIGEVKAQLFALQSQMNPHFIHNTLAVIQAYANEGDSYTVNLVCDKLSNIIRYGASYDNSKVEFTDEINHAQNYIDLLKLRYERNIDIKTIKSENIDGIKVPKFILQPIIENSLEHGLKSKRFPWSIVVTIETDGDIWKAHIKDNGVGMSQKQIDEIYAYIAKVKKGDIDVLNENLKIGGLSIKNIAGRLYLEYKEDMIFNIDSKPNEYLTITLGGTAND